MATKVLSIEVGSNLTRVVEIDYKAKQPKVYNMFQFPTPEGMVSEAGVQVDPIFKTALESQLKQHKISTKKAIFVLNSARIANREIEIPYVKENRIKEFLQSNATDYFPIDLNLYKLTHEVIEKVEDGENKKLKLSVIAVPFELITSYQNLAAYCGLALFGLDYTGNAIKQLMNEEISEEVKVTIKVDENTSILTVVQEGAVKLQRTLNYGLADAVERIQESNLFGEYLSFTDAMDIARRKTLIYNKFEGTFDSGDIDLTDGVDQVRLAALKEAVTDSLRPLINNVGRVLDYYQSQNIDSRIEKIYVIGMGADFSGLSKLMAAELNQRVVTLQRCDYIAMQKNVDLDNVNPSEFFTCLGAALSPLNIVESQKAVKAVSEDAPANAGEQTSSGMALPILVCALLIIGAIGMAAYGIITTMMIKTANAKLENQIYDLAYAEEIKNEYDATKASYDYVVKLDENTNSYNNNLADFIEELEKKMPTKIQITSIDANEFGVSLSMMLESKTAVAAVYDELRNFDTVTPTNISTIEDSQNEDSELNVSVVVDCTYVEKAESDQ